VRTALRPLVAQLMELRLQIKSIEKETPCLASDKPGKPAVGNDPRSGVYYGDNGTA
jgi:hypothetical protein